MTHLSEAYSESYQISKMEHIAKIVNGYKSLTIFEKRSILDKEVATGGVLQRKVFLKVSQISQENICVKVSFQ